MSSRFARALPIVSALNAFPLGLIARLPFSRHLGREDDVLGDDDVITSDVLDDPVVGGIESTGVRHDLEIDPRLGGDPQPGPGHERDREPVSLRRARLRP